MSAARVGAGAPIAGRLPGIQTGHSGAAGVAAPSSVVALPASGLTQIRYGSTWPRGWMAAAVPQQIREFNTQVSKAQLAQEFLQELDRLCDTLAQTVKRQLQLPSVAGLQRAQQALEHLQQHWQMRYTQTAGSLDERLHWSATQTARKFFTLAGWTHDTLQAKHAQDQELVSFSLMGQDAAQGAWLSQHGRSKVASQFALASALAPLQIQLHLSLQALRMSVAEHLWPQLQARFVVKGNGQRFPAGQWVSAPLRRDESALPIDAWTAQDDAALEKLQLAMPAVKAAIAAAQAQVAQFYEQAQHSLGADAAALSRMQDFTAAFHAAAQTAGYEWVSTVVPAVRSISRQRVTRLLQTPALR
ncbi:hypothetical protein [Comamonas sp.]